MRFTVGAGGADDGGGLPDDCGIAVGALVGSDGGNVGAPGNPGGRVIVTVGLGCVVAVGKISSGTGVGVGMINAQPVVLITSSTAVTKMTEYRNCTLELCLSVTLRRFANLRKGLIYRVNRLRICGTP
jgi:hypothetical protein